MDEKNIHIPKQKRSRETKLSIINAGLKLFSEKGYYKTNSKEIAGEADVSIGAFYIYFQDKKALFKEILIDYHKKIRTVLENLEIKKYIETGKKKEFLIYLINKLIEAHDIYPQFHQEVSVMAQSDPDISKIIEKSQLESLKVTKAILLTWKDKIRVKDINAAAIVVQTSIEETVHAMIFSKFNVPAPKIINELSEMLFRYLS
ncbi:MAG: TetR/AcrR family transcriptional regulator [Spirochaetes bacterium]|nr:TetR/AcrR family transcriptional regulator [Spirochaetota bacterium]